MYNIDRKYWQVLFLVPETESMAYFHKKSAFPVFFCVFGPYNFYWNNYGNILKDSWALFGHTVCHTFHYLFYEIFAFKHRKIGENQCPKQNITIMKKLKKYLTALILTNINVSEFFWLPNMCKKCVMMFFPVLSAYFYIFEM